MTHPSSIPHPRRIKSFVIREGRLTLRQLQALANQQNTYLLPKPEALLNWQEIFQRDAPVTLEIGFGMGHALLQNAQRLPEQNFVGIEVYRPGIGTLLAEANAAQLTNIRVLHGDAVEILNSAIPDNSLAGVQIFFADPWPKRRHHKRRLIQIPFVELVVEKLQPGGYLHLATDWEDYAKHMLRVLSAITTLKNTAEDGQFAKNRGDRPLTKYEQRGQRLGHQVWDLIFVK